VPIRVYQAIICKYRLIGMDNPLKKIIQTMLLTAMPFTGQATAATLAPETLATNPGLFSQLAVEAGITILTLACMLLVHQLWRFYQRAQRREAEVRQQIWRQANYDYLTQLPNRYLLQDCLEKSIQECQQSQQQLGLLLIDLDGFKDVNDIAGHAVGDRLLQNAALRIQSCVRDGDTTAKLGGDEFVVVIPKLKDIKVLHDIGAKIVETVRSPFHIDDNQYFVTASIGIAVFPDHSDSAETLMMYADQALYAAKRAGKNQYQFFTQTMQQEIRERISLTHDLRSAIENNELHLVYQPIYRLQDISLIKAEALIRWQHPTRGNIPPSVFIPIAEESGIIIEIGKWIFNEVLHDLSTIDPMRLQGIQISLNISPIQFAHPQHLMAFIKRLERSNIPCELFCFEITEGLLLEPSKVIQDTLKTLKQAGIKLSIDDFGTGYSALGYLKKYHIDYVKIDKSFINNLGVDNYDFILCRSIIQMAHELNMQLIAEGVENAQQESILKVINCDFIQGFLHGKPAMFSSLLEQLDLQMLQEKAYPMLGAETKMAALQHAATKAN
jgi:diguanylate cyclase (GGDEF)-like protein